jgi:hypothetical protein
VVFGGVLDGEFGFLGDVCLLTVVVVDQDGVQAEQGGAEAVMGEGRVVQYILAYKGVRWGGTENYQTSIEVFDFKSFYYPIIIVPDPAATLSHSLD